VWRIAEKKANSIEGNCEKWANSIEWK